MRAFQVTSWLIQSLVILTVLGVAAYGFEGKPKITFEEEFELFRSYNSKHWLVGEAKGNPFLNITCKYTVMTRTGRAQSKFIDFKQMFKKGRTTTVDSVEYLEDTCDHKTFRIEITQLGLYNCTVCNGFGCTYHVENIKYEGSYKLHRKSVMYIQLIVVVVLVALITVYYIKQKHNKKLWTKKLEKIGLNRFEKGDIKSLIPYVDIREQACLLPYKSNAWDLSRDCIVLGKQIGSGTFGDILIGETERELSILHTYTETVAVKKSKPECDITALQSLVSELKVMIHVGYHPNIVNILNACTENLLNLELLITLEYCKFGDVLTFLQGHRRFFVSQLNPWTNEFDPSHESFTRIFRTFHNEQSSITEYNLTPIMFGDGSFLEFSHPKEIKSEGMDGHQISKDYDETTSTEEDVVCTEDLISWAMQIARGLDYLASRKMFHGNLSARKVLLDENKVPKITGFWSFNKTTTEGSVKRKGFKSEDSKGTGDTEYTDVNTDSDGKFVGRRSIQWMAPEVTTGGIFSIESDIWAYGGTLWEMFTAPYEEEIASDGFENAAYQKLTGHDLVNRPPCASVEIHKLMMDCWQTDPLERPTFSELACRLARMVEGNVKHNPNAHTWKMKKRDYLSLLETPSYTNRSKSRSNPIKYSTEKIIETI